MTNTTWTNDQDVLLEDRPNRLKFVVAGLLIIAALGYLIFNVTQQEGTTQLYITIAEYYDDPGKYAGKDLRIAGWVLGDSIQFTQISDTETRLEFDVVDDINNPHQTMRIVALNEPKPDLLQHEAQALVEGHVEGNAFIANQDGLLLKCPTRYEELEPPA
jgi:cytochrome c-type biogenesis protein CcmE